MTKEEEIENLNLSEVAEFDYNYSYDPNNCRKCLAAVSQ